MNETPSKSKRYEDKVAVREVRERLDRLAATGEDGLPMPLMDVARRKLGREEMIEFAARYYRQCQRVAGYDETFVRPSAEMALRAVEYLQTLAGWNEAAYEALHEDPETRAQLAVAVLDVAICAARYAPMRRLKNRNLTVSAVANAMLRGWSPRFRHEVETGPARLLSQMDRTVAENCLRDLQRQGIRLKTVWNFVTDWAIAEDLEEAAGEDDLQPVASRKFKGTGLYRLRRQRGNRKGQRVEHLVVTLNEEAVAPLERVLLLDLVYCRHRVRDCWRLMLANEPAQSAHGRRHVAAGVEFDMVTIGDETKAVIKLMGSAHLGFDADRFMLDYEAAKLEAPRLRRQLNEAYHQERVRLEALGALHEGKKGKQKPIRAARFDEHGKLIQRASVGRLHYRGQPKPVALRALQNETAAMESFVETFRAVREQIETLKLTGVVPIKTTFYKVPNRRYETSTLWPQRTSGKLGQMETRHIPYDDEHDEGHVEEVRMAASPRWDWFKTPLGGDLDGFDVSSSQSQILAFLLGLRDLEEIASGGGTGKSFKVRLAELVWEARDQVLVLGNVLGNDSLVPPYSGPSDPRLIEASKSLWTRVPYGSEIKIVVRDHRQRPDVYGPGWRSPEAVEEFLRAKVPGFNELLDFLDAMRVIGETADEYAGLTLVDPLDNTPYTWNPVRVAADTVQSGGLRVPLYLPGHLEDRVDADGKPFKDKAGFTLRRFVPHEADSAGRYPCDVTALMRKVSPCLTHSLDALFAALVVKGLAARGVTSFASIHDAWLVPVDQVGLLEDAIKEAATGWVARLGPVYDRIEALLRKSRQDKYLAAWIDARQAWEQRRDAGEAPAVLYKPAALTQSEFHESMYDEVYGDGSEDEPEP